MPGGFPLGLEVCNGRDIGAVPATSLGTTLTANASANTKGAYAQLVAATPADCSWIDINYQHVTTASVIYAIDIAIGPAGSEKDIIPNIVCGQGSAASQGNAATRVTLPLQIPAGTRISGRCQCSTGSDTARVHVETFDGGIANLEGYAGVDALSFQSATSAGTNVDPGGTINTKGAWTQLIAATARDYAGLLVGTDSRAITSVPGAPLHFLFDIGVGAAGAEQAIISNLPEVFGVTTLFSQIGYLFVPIPIPAGTRISARAQCDGNTAASRILNLDVYGAYQ